jgi:hypothetical protein
MVPAMLTKGKQIHLKELHFVLLSKDNHSYHWSPGSRHSQTSARRPIPCHLTIGQDWSLVIGCGSSQ